MSSPLSLSLLQSVSSWLYLVLYSSGSCGSLVLIQESLYQTLCPPWFSLSLNGKHHLCIRQVSKSHPYPFSDWWACQRRLHKPTGVSSPTTELPQGYLAMLPCVPHPALHLAHHAKMWSLLHTFPTIISTPNPIQKTTSSASLRENGTYQECPRLLPQLHLPPNSTGSGICSRHFFYPVKVALLWTVDHHPWYTCAACSFLLGDLTPLMIPVERQSAWLPPVCRSVYVSCLRRAFLQPFSPLPPTDHSLSFSFWMLGTTCIVSLSL